MSDLSGPLHALLSGVAAVTAKLAAYRSAPAIFTQPVLPPDFDRAAVTKPYVVSDGDVARNAIDLSDTAWIVVRDVHVLDRNDGGPSEVDAAAGATADALRGAALTISGHRARITAVAGPAAADPDAETFGRTVRITVLLEEN